MDAPRSTSPHRPRRRFGWPTVVGAGVLGLVLAATPAGAAVGDFITSPDGSRWTITVDNDGKLGTDRQSNPTPTASPTSTTPTASPTSGAPALAFSSGWTKAGADTYTSRVGATATITFTGTGLTVSGVRDAHHANATVTVDGKAAGSTTSKAATRSTGTIFSVGGLAAGTHTVVLTATGTVSVTGATLGGTSTTPTASPTSTAPTSAPTTTAPPVTTPPTTPPASGKIQALSVTGNKITYQGGGEAWLLGYNSFTMGGACGDERKGEVSAANRDAKPFIDSMRKDGHGVLRLFYWSHYSAADKAKLQDLVNYAGERNIYTILTLSDGQKGCGNAGPSTLSANSYAHVKEAATRFKDNPAVAFFEVANEPTSSDWSAGYLDKVKGTVSTIKGIDGDRLVGSGNQAAYFLGGGPTEEKNRQRAVNAQVDIASMHDYEGGCDASRTREEIGLAGGKPLIMGEFGTLEAGPFNNRSATFACKIATWQKYDGFAAALGWAWQPGNGSSASEYGNLDADTKTQQVLRTASLG